VLVTIDSSVVVASLLAHDPRHREALVLMEQVLKGEVRAVMPCSVLVEVVAAIRRQTGSEQAALEVALVVQTALEHHTQPVSFDEKMLRKSRSVLS